MQRILRDSRSGLGRAGRLDGPGPGPEGSAVGSHQLQQPPCGPGRTQLSPMLGPTPHLGSSALESLRWLVPVFRRPMACPGPPLAPAHPCTTGVAVTGLGPLPSPPASGGSSSSSAVFRVLMAGCHGHCGLAVMRNVAVSQPCLHKHLLLICKDRSPTAPASLLEGSLSFLGLDHPHPALGLLGAATIPSLGWLLSSICS